MEMMDIYYRTILNYHIAHGATCMSDLSHSEQLKLVACKIRQQPEYRRYEAIVESDKENTLANNFLSAMTGEVTSEQFLTYLITNALKYYALDIDEDFEQLIEASAITTIDDLADEAYHWRATL
jgi:hypothetical protein